MTNQPSDERRLFRGESPVFRQRFFRSLPHVTLTVEAISGGGEADIRLHHLVGLHYNGVAVQLRSSRFGGPVLRDVCGYSCP